MKILGSNEELASEGAIVNPNPIPATAPILEHNPLEAAVASASGASPPQFMAQVRIGCVNYLGRRSLLILHVISRPT